MAGIDISIWPLQNSAISNKISMGGTGRMHFMSDHISLVEMEMEDMSELWLRGDFFEHVHGVRPNVVH